jgi:hypothetical protein
MEWPKYLPKSCPPDDAECKSIQVYRFLEDSCIKQEYFLTVRELQPSRKFPEPEKECRACSLSVFTNREEVISLQKRVPRWRKPVAVGRLTETSGKVKHTPSHGTNNSHHSWWVPKDVKSWALFHEIIETPKST